MKLALLVAALACELAAAGSWFGVVVHAGDRRAHGLVALGLALYLLALQPRVPRPPRGRRDA